jgi:AcrR family transcriptional regulator
MAERLTRQEQQQRTRDQLVDMAMELFAEHGIANVSLERVAAAVGRTKGAVYANFTSKEELVMEVINRHGGADLDAGPPPSQAGAADGASFERLGRGYATAIAKRRRFALFYLELWLYAMRNESARERFIGRLEDLIAASAEELAKGYGLPDDLTPREVGRLVMSADLGIGMQCVLAPERFPADLYGKAVRRILTPPREQD